MYTARAKQCGPMTRFKRRPFPAIATTKQPVPNKLVTGGTHQA